jgi:hypothetical protein
LGNHTGTRLGHRLRGQRAAQVNSADRSENGSAATEHPANDNNATGKMPQR